MLQNAFILHTPHLKRKGYCFYVKNMINIVLMTRSFLRCIKFVKILVAIKRNSDIKCMLLSVMYRISAKFRNLFLNKLLTSLDKQNKCFDGLTYNDSRNDLSLNSYIRFISTTIPVVAS